MSKYNKGNRADNNRNLNNSPSTSQMASIDKASSTKKKRNLIHGVSNGSIGKSGMLIQSSSGSGLPTPGQSNGNYSRIVNIYSVNNKKNNRKS